MYMLLKVFGEYQSSSHVFRCKLPGIVEEIYICDCIQLVLVKFIVLKINRPAQTLVGVTDNYRQTGKN